MIIYKMSESDSENNDNVTDISGNVTYTSPQIVSDLSSTTIIGTGY